MSAFDLPHIKNKFLRAWCEGVFEGVVKAPFAIPAFIFAVYCSIKILTAWGLI